MRNSAPPPSPCVIEVRGLEQQIPTSSLQILRTIHNSSFDNVSRLFWLDNQTPWIKLVKNSFALQLIRWL